MNLKELKYILNSGYTDSMKEGLIINIIAQDKNAIPTILKLLQSERELKEDLILDSNMELSRAAAALKDPKLVEHSWVVEQIKLHYEKWKDVIKCNFKL